MAGVVWRDGTNQLMDMATELHLKVFDSLDDPSLCTLGVTCKYFNDLVFPYYFSKHNIPSLEFGSFTKPWGRVKCLLQAVRCSLKAKHITKLHITFDRNVARLPDDFRELMAIVRQTARLQNAVVYAADLDLGSVTGSGDTLPEGFGLEQWVRACGDLIEAIAAKHCNEITFYHGKRVHDFFEKRSRVQLPRALKVGVDNSPVEETRFELQRAPQGSSLKTINFNSCMLLSPLFVDWTIPFLERGAHTITHLALKSNDSYHEMWDRALTLPHLTHFTVSDSLLGLNGPCASASSLAGFLSRHPSIERLDLHGISDPGTPIPSTTILSDILPSLTHIMAHPTTISWILHAKKDWSSLGSVTPSVSYDALGRAFDHQLLDRALETLVSRKASLANCSLGFQFNVYASALSNWFQSHIDAGPKSGLISHFTGTRTLEIRSRDFSELLCSDRIERFTRWVALFPNVEELSLQIYPVSVDEFQIVPYFQRYCPRVRKLVYIKMANTKSMLNIPSPEGTVST